MNGQTISLLERVQETLAQYAMLEGVERVIAAVSGGPDSVFLLHALHELGLKIEVAHFDHQTRNGASSSDAAFVRDLAERLGLPFHFESRPIEREAVDAGVSFETYARQVRYEFFVRIALERGCNAIATGHQADDQAETVLFRILRGASPRGLGGIPPVRWEGPVRVIRPLLACTRAEILAYLNERGLGYCRDTTNTDTRYLRNRVRHELLPRLSGEYNPRVREALCRLAELQRIESDYLEAQAAPFLEGCLETATRLRRKVFAEGHPAIQRRALLLWAWRHGVDPPYDRVDGAVHFIMEGPTGRGFDLGQDIQLRNAREITELRRLSVSAPQSHQDRPISLAVPGVTAGFGKRFYVRFLEGLPAQSLAEYCTCARQVFDADALGTALAARRRRAGDRFTPLGMTGRKKLKDYFTELGLTPSDREKQLILTGDGEIAWVIGHGVSAHVAITPATRRLLEVHVEDRPESD